MKLNSDTFISQVAISISDFTLRYGRLLFAFSIFSYEYESPEVDFDEAVEPFISKDVRLSKIMSLEEWSNDKNGGDNVETERIRMKKSVQTCIKKNSLNLDDNGHIQLSHNLNRMDADSLSLPSEPPDIRNWFSSYVYESPELDIGTDLNSNLFKESQHDQQDIGIKQKSKERESNMIYITRTCVDEFGVNKKDGFADLIECRSPLESDSDDHNDLHLTDSLSLPSDLDYLSSINAIPEPPDIRTWFSSYVYESPSPFTDGESGVPVIPEIQSGKCDECILMRNEVRAKCGTNRSSSIKIQKSIDEKGVLTDLTPRRNHSESDNYMENYSVEGSSKNNDCSPVLSDQIVEETQSQCGIHNITGIDIIKIVNEANSPSLKNKTVSDNNELRYRRRLLRRTNFTVKHSSRESCFREEVSAAKRVSSEVVKSTEDPGRNTESFKRTIISKQVDSTERADKENEQPDSTKNGFISTKKTRKKIPNYENSTSLQKQHRVLVDNLSITKSVQGSIITTTSKRMALPNVTNTQHSVELETSRKWKCPQRSKANLRPPLKQLRLEQWVTRA
ncbi:unnamed protein product [Rhodiola kirilowii]